MGVALLSLAGAAGVTVLGTLLVRRHAPAIGLVAARPLRLNNSLLVPTAGGLAIVLGIVTVPALGALLGSWTVPAATDPLLVVLIGTVAASIVGLLDDVRALGPTRKLGAQVALAATVYFAGLRLTEIELPFLGTVALAPALALIGTVAWLVMVMNAFNLSDGADGVAAGIAAVAALALLVPSVAAGRDELSFVLLVTIAALAAFLWFNFPPSSVIMGDAGSLSLGFLLGGLVLVGGAPGEGGVGLVAAVVILGVPLMDTGLAVVRRLLSRAAIMRADHGHLHHRLLELGFTPRQVAWSMYLAAGMLGIAGTIIARNPNDTTSLLIVLAIMLMAGLAVRRLRMPELVGAARLLRGTLERRDQISRNVRIVRQLGRLRSAADVDEVQSRLERVLREAGFDQAEIWLVSKFPGRDEVAARRGWEPSGSGSRWRWNRLGASVLPLERCWEVKLPILSDGRKQVGRLTLRRSLSDLGPIALDVLVGELLPALGEALRRLGPVPLEALEVDRERWAG